MSRFVLFVLSLHIALAVGSCIVQQKKGNPNIRVIRLDDSSKDSGNPDIRVIRLDDSSKDSGNPDIRVIRLDDSSKDSENPDIRVIRLDDSSKDSSEPEILALHLPDRRRRETDSQEKNTFCQTDEDCGPGAVCLAYLTCVKGTWQPINSLEADIAN